MRLGPPQLTAAASWLALSAGGLLAMTTAGHLHAEPAVGAAPPVQAGVTADTPITVVLTRYARPGCEAKLEALVNETFRDSAKIAGQPIAEFVRPSEPNSRAYTLIVRFSHNSDYQRWLESPQRALWLERSAKLADGPPQYKLPSGLEAWVTPPDEAGHRAPDPYKTIAVNFVALYPAYVVSTLMLSPAVAGLHPLAVAGVSSAFSILVGGFIVMPYVAPLFRDWLFPPVAECRAG